MTSPPERIRVTCPACGTEYESWWRPSVNAALDPELVADEEYMRRTSTATCPDCEHRVRFDQLVVTEDWEFRYTARTPEEGERAPDANPGDA